MALAALVAWPGPSAAVERPADAGCAGMHLSEPTDEYGHRELGPNSEYKEISGADGEVLVRLGAGRVFEDVGLRCVDLDGDGAPEVVVVESAMSEGAQLAVYASETRADPDLPGLFKSAATPPLGRRFRWLAPAGIADFDGDGQIEIAVVIMPDLVGRLELWGFVPGGLTREAVAEGFVSNHRTGDAFVTAATRDCGGLPLLLVPTANFDRIVAVRFDRAGPLLHHLPDELRPTPELLERLTDCATRLPDDPK